MHTRRRSPHRLLMTALLLVMALPLTALAGMESSLEHYLSSADLRGTQVSICVMDVGEREMLVEINADDDMIPASNMKLVTSAAALSTLGKDFKFSTQLRLLGVKEAPAGDGLPALVILGDGDPAFGAPKVLKDAGYDVGQMMGWWLDAVEKTGINQFGQIIIDDRVFANGESQRVHPTWPKNQLHKWYCAQVMGINFYDNCFQVTAHPDRSGINASVEIYPFGPFVQTEMRLRTGRTDQWDIITRADSNRMSFRGTIRSRQTKDVAMHDPAMVFGQMLQNELKKRNITVNKVVRPAGDQRIAQGKTLHKINTTLQAVLNRTNRDSMNLYAEALLKRSGHAFTGAPGSFENGAAAVRAYLSKALGDPTLAASVQIADGSGLSRDNKISTRALVELLRAQAVGKNFKPFLASLAQPGKDGSLKLRLIKNNKTQAKVYAKTGTINFVSALSGYLVYPEGGPNNTARVLAFSMIFNGHGKGAARNISGADIRKLQDELVKVMDKEALAAVAP